MPRIIYKNHRGTRLPSVTTIIGRFKESGGLLYWANQQGLEGKTLDEARVEVTTPGTLAHRAVEDHINGRPETALGARVTLSRKPAAPMRRTCTGSQSTGSRFVTLKFRSRAKNTPSAARWTRSV